MASYTESKTESKPLKTDQPSQEFDIPSNSLLNLNDLIQSCEDISRFPIAYVCLFNGEVPWIPVSVRFPFQRVNQTQLPDHILLEYKNPLIIQDLDEDPRVPEVPQLIRGLQWKSWMSRPLFENGNQSDPIGSISFASRHGPEINPRTRILLKKAAELAQDIIRNDQNSVRNIHRSLLNATLDSLNQKRKTELVKNDKFFKTLFESHTEAVFLIKDGEFIECNQNAADLFGVSGNQLIENTPFSYSPPLQPDGRPSDEKAKDLMMQAQNGNHLTFEWIQQTPSGNKFTVECEYTPVEYESDRYLFAHYRKIPTEEARTGIRGSSVHLFDRMFHTLSEAIVVTDVEGYIVYLDSNDSEPFEVPGEIVGDHLSTLCSFWEDSIVRPEQFTQWMDQCFNHPGAERTHSVPLSSGNTFVCQTYPTLLPGNESTSGRLWKFHTESPESSTDHCLDTLAAGDPNQYEPVLRLDSEGKIVYTNIASEPILNMWHCQAGNCLPDRWRSVAREAREHNGQIRKKLQCGSTVYNLSFVSDPDEETVRIYGRDVDREKQSSRTSDNDDEFYSLANVSPFIVYRLNKNGTITFVNSEIQKLGYNPSDLIGEHFSTLIDPDQLQSVSRTHVLSRYRGRETDSENTPQLFDERRTGDRGTSNLKLTIQNRTEKQANRTFRVNSCGLYSGSPGSPESTFLGTIGIMRESVWNTEVESSTSENQQKLLELSYHDQLTGLRNRRYFEKIYKKEWNRHSRSDATLTLFLADIDHFKIYNDTYGHPQGDQCLESLADVMKESLDRPSDVIARYGGEEFIGLLPNTDRSGGETVAEKLRSNVRKNKIPFDASPIAEIVTVSVGVASSSVENEDRERLIKKADEALYEAKQKGRDSVVAID